MRSRIQKNPARFVFKLIAVAVLIFLCARGAYTQGVQHAIASAMPYTDGASIMIDFDGEVHEYR